MNGQPPALRLEGSGEKTEDPLLALQLGERGPFERFVRESAATLLGFFRRLGASDQEAEDLTQDVYMKLYLAAPRYAPDERFTAFVFRVARNAWTDAGRRRAARIDLRQAAGEDELALVAEPEGLGALDALSHGEQAQALRAAAARLSDGHRLVFELGVLQELSYEEIARTLDIPVGTVKSRMHHALRRLRAALHEQPDADAQPDARERGSDARERGSDAHERGGAPGPKGAR